MDPAVTRTEAPSASLRAPFPWFGGKSRVAHVAWDRFGDVPNYVEPFAGSLAVLLTRPHEPGTETVNDLDCYVANFWRAVAADPEAVSRWADSPVNEADLHARHRWLHSRDDFREHMKSDPEHFDARVAGWWCWGISAWIGSGWCRVRRDGAAPSGQLPHLGNAGMGLHRKLPHLGDAGRVEWISALSARLRRVRVACGDWSRVVGPSVTEKHGMTAVLLDPPYADDGHAIEYGAETSNVAASVREWAIANGDNPLLRIALCGYEGGDPMPPSWSEHAWKAKGGYGSQGDGRGRENAARERVWFSPHCISAAQPSLFGAR